ncbi:MAG TPA: CsgG/HfaB family protein [Candidatus Binatia bacterium]|nr:CsgG/HfaB family protein [Candidatus Binatia bacterium]
MYLTIVVFAVMLTVASSGPIGEVTTQTASASERNINEAQLESYDGPKARVAVYRFEDQSAKGGGGKSHKTGWYSKEIGNGMADMLNDALVRSNRFLVLDRQSLQDVFMEQDLGATGRIRPITAPKIGVIEGADLLIKGSVTEFEPGSSGGNDSSALRYFGGAPAAIIGGFLGGVEQSHVAMVVQVVDATTSRILFSTTVEGNAKDYNLSGFLGGFGKNFSTSGGLGVWQNTPMEKAIRLAIVAAVQEISNKTPNIYYRYGDLPPTNSAPTENPLKSEPSAATDVTFTAVKVNSANLRDAPGGQGKVTATLKAGTNLLVNAEDKDWYFVQTEDGKSSGWIAKSLTK